MAEWFKAAVLKTAVGSRSPWVRIPPSPPNSIAPHGLQSGESDETLVDYLVLIETEHMGLTETPATRMRAKETVATVREHLAKI